jgi:acyl carrier protein
MTDQLIQVFSDILGVPTAELNEQTSPANTEAWDSMAGIMLVTEIEATFGVELSTSDIETMSSIGQARAVLKRLGANT